jgi:hypothetical protein
MPQELSWVTGNPRSAVEISVMGRQRRSATFSTNLWRFHG